MSYQKRPIFSVKIRRYIGKVLPKPIYLKYFTRHEKTSLNLWRLLAEKVPEKLSILDIGAFHGEFAVAARKVNNQSEIYAFEPNSESLKILRPICQNNQIKVITERYRNCFVELNWSKSMKKEIFKCEQKTLQHTFTTN